MLRMNYMCLNAQSTTALYGYETAHCDATFRAQISEKISCTDFVHDFGKKSFPEFRNVMDQYRYNMVGDNIYIYRYRYRR